ncbi:MAG: oligosaccharide flippase family protein [Candidatus Sericytochromatia bacterium]
MSERLKSTAQSWGRSTLSNYGLLALRMVSMVVLTRSLFLALSPEEYGFWALIWSLFSFTLLLDFGFGTAVQKWTSQSCASGDWPRYSRLLGSLLLSYGVMAALMALSVVPVSFFLPRLFQFAGSPAPYQQLFLLFGLGCALIFPTGMAAEMLRGLKLIQSRNRIQAAVLLLQTLGSLWALHGPHSLLLLTLWTLLTTLGGNLWMFRRAFQALPPDLRPGRPSGALLREVAGFSVYAWIITLTNLVIFRSDQLVIGATLGVSAIAGYQIAGRLADVFRQFTTQLHDYLGPLAARAHQAGDQALLQRSLLDAGRWSSLLAVLLGLPLALGLNDLLWLWLEIDQPEIQLCAQILLFSMGVQVSLRTTPTQILLMCQRERLLMAGGLAEAVLNLGLSLWLAPRLGLVGVALGTLLPNLVLAGAFQVPLASRLSGLRLSTYLLRSSAPAWGCGLLVWALARVLLLPLQAQAPLLRLLASVTLCVALLLPLLYRVGLTAGERDRLKNTLQDLPARLMSRRRSGYTAHHATSTQPAPGLES